MIAVKSLEFLLHSFQIKFQKGDWLGGFFGQYLSNKSLRQISDLKKNILEHRLMLHRSFLQFNTLNQQQIISIRQETT